MKIGAEWLPGLSAGVIGRGRGALPDVVRGVRAARAPVARINVASGADEVNYPPAQTQHGSPLASRAGRHLQIRLSPGRLYLVILVE